MKNVYSVLVVSTLLFFTLLLGHSFALENNKCYECHDTDAKKFSSSAHGALECINCHKDIEKLPHASKPAPVKCALCHGDAEKGYKQSIHFQGGKNGIKKIPSCHDCHGTHYILGPKNRDSLVYPTKLPQTCARCHADESLVKEYHIPVPQPYKAYMKGIHGRAVIDKGEVFAANCSSCHGYHNIKSARDVSSSIYKWNIPVMCSKCHPGIYEEWEKGVHGSAAKRGVSDAPVCTTCHGEHEILSVKGSGSGVHEGSTISKLSVSKTCSQCHGSERLIKKYGLPSGKVTTYDDSYHGLADKYGDTTVANCASCHGAHAILPASNPKSLVSPQNLRITCGKCHPGATQNFAKGLVHGGIKALYKIPELVKYYVKKFYIFLIVIVVLGMVLHNGLDFLAKLRTRYRLKKAEGEFLRFSLSQRIQHVFLFSSFIILAISGFALRYKVGFPFLHGDTNALLRSYIHRGAAIVFVCVSIYHLFHLLKIFVDGRKKGEKLSHIFPMLPGVKDIRDAVVMLQYYVGLRSSPPKFGRYSYMEKLEYLALIWGAAIMIVTGIMLWFEDATMIYVPKWGIDIAGIIHFYEAILACLAIVVWHFYFVILNPDVAPMNMVWLTGKLSREEMEHEHQLELEIEETKRGGA